jgi:ABC-2 type transport system permease protein
MITRIARKEFTEMSRDGRFRLAALMVFSLLLVSLLTGWKRYRDIKTQHELAQRETRDRWLQQPP